MSIFQFFIDNGWIKYMVFKYNQMKKQKAGRDKISKIESSIKRDKIDQIKDEDREINEIEKFKIGFILIHSIK